MPTARKPCLGRGDMLYLPSGSARVHRLHAPYVTEKEIAAVVEFWRSQGLAEYEEKFLQAPKEEREDGRLGSRTVKVMKKRRTTRSTKMP